MFTFWTVEHSRDISLSLFPIIYLVAKDTILYLLSLFDERREQKKLSRRMVFVVERNEDVVLLRARAPESIRAFNGKNDVYRKEERLKKNKMDDRSNTRRKHFKKKNFFVPAGDVSLGNSRVQANGLSNSLSDRKHFY